MIPTKPTDHAPTHWNPSGVVRYRPSQAYRPRPHSLESFRCCTIPTKPSLPTTPPLTGILQVLYGTAQAYRPRPHSLESFRCCTIPTKPSLPTTPPLTGILQVLYDTDQAKPTDHAPTHWNPSGVVRYRPSQAYRPRPHSPESFRCCTVQQNPFFRGNRWCLNSRRFCDRANSTLRLCFSSVNRDPSGNKQS